MAKIEGKSLTEKKQEGLIKEAVITAALQAPDKSGLLKLAAALTTPVRYYLDHYPIGRQLLVVEPYPDGVPLYFDNDIAEFDAVIVADDGASRRIVAKSTRTMIPELEIAARVYIPFKELKYRKFNVIDRAKQRLMQSLGIREDLTIFAAIHTSSVITNAEYVIAGPLSKEILTRCIYEVEKHRLNVDKILGSPALSYSVRNWEWTQIDELARQEVRTTGYLGTLFGTRFYISQLIKPDPTTGLHYAYVLSAPEYLGWMPIRADTEVIPADEPGNLLLGFTGYEHLGIIIYNPFACARVGFELPS